MPDLSLSTDPDTPRPLPRRAVPHPATPARANRPRFQALDAVWALLLVCLSLAHSAWLGELEGRRLLGSVTAAAIAGALYLLGWRARDRAAGVSAGLLAAASPQFLFLAAYAPQSALFALLSVAALFAFVAGSSLAALVFAAGAAIVRLDGFLLGLLLLAVSVVQGRKRTGYGAALFLVPLLVYGIGRFLLDHSLPRLPDFGPHGSVWHWIGSSASLLLLWLLLPFCGEWGEPQRRARWLPVVLWTGISLVSVSALSLTTPGGMLLPILPLVFSLAGGGLSRLLPTLGGDSSRPLVRYALATAAVLLLVGLHSRLEPGFNTSAESGLRSR